MTIHPQPCPRCRNRRSARLFGVFHCFNCNHQWTGASDAAALPVQPFPFSQDELRRLSAYRGAVRAGVYSDWPVFVA